jgi:adenine-specific DNA methylase
MPTDTLRQTASFIESQFPVSKVSKESYKERKANHSQTLTGLGKWWGRKPLVMIRAAILGLLIPPSDDPKRDREIFLKIMTMDNDGLWQRKSKNISYNDVFEGLTEEQRARYFDMEAVATGKAKHHCILGDSREEKRKLKDEMQRLVFEQLSYDDKLQYCDRPEQIEGPSEEAWAEINAHLNTHAQSLPDLVEQLGKRQFGHVPRVGDAFCGGGSVPFEAARLGCEAFGSDLNPVATLLTWAGLNIVGGGEDVAEQITQAQGRVFDAVDRQITEWGIEHNARGWRADAYLYCLETVCPECGTAVPLAPSWVIGKGTKAIAQLRHDSNNNRFDIEIEQGVAKSALEEADGAGTVGNKRLQCPSCNQATPIEMIRGDRRIDDGSAYGLRMWTNEEVAPRPGDTFQERLYCVRWVETKADGSTKRHYRSVTEGDLAREAKVLSLLEDRFHEWQAKGFIPSRRIEPGAKTTEPIRTRGWTHWHHLFNPRQLLVNGTFMAKTGQADVDKKGKVSILLAIGRCADWNSKLCRWNAHGANEKSEQVFSNQALNTLYNYASRALASVDTTFFRDIPSASVEGTHITHPKDARRVEQTSDFWITDPPYADAINYHELSEYFTAWYEKPLQRLFPLWYSVSKRALAITGDAGDFRRDMVASYRNLADHMPDDGAQIVMFTHQDASVWADLTLIMWAAGLRVTAAWTIATETDSALKKGNYVQGTVLLVLRKRTEERTAYTDELSYQIEDEVRAQLDSMQALDADEDEPSFGDTDLQLAAYAAALRVLTQYSSVEEWDIEKELARPRSNGRPSPIEEVIDKAVKIACDHLIPKQFDSFLWKTLTPHERLYLKGLELEKNGEFRTGAYQELARGFGVRQYKHLLADGSANKTRFMNATEFGSRLLGEEGFGSSNVRQALFAVHEARKENDAQAGRLWLRNEVSAYWTERKKLIEILRYFAAMHPASPHWEEDADVARLVAGAVTNDTA